MSNEIKIIQQSLVDEAEAIREALKEPNIVGIYPVKKRRWRWGRRIVQELVNANDTNVIEPKQLPNPK